MPELSWDEARSLVLPHVRDRFFLEVIRLKAILEDQPHRPFPYRELTDHLCVMPAIVVSQELRLVTTEQLTAWGIGLDEMLEQAARNLAAATEERLIDKGVGVLVSPWQDPLDAARILLDDLFRGLTIAGDPVLLIPNPQTLIVTGTDDAEALAAAFELAEQASAQERPISATPFIRRWPGYETLELAAHHPAYAAWRRLCLIDQVLTYEPQRNLLEAVHAKTEDQTRVGRCRLREDHQTGELTTHCVWERGVEVLLPEVSDVALFDREHADNDGVIAIVPWAAIEKHCSDLLQQTEHYPRRFLVDGFPADPVVERLVEEFGAEEFAR